MQGIEQLGYNDKKAHCKSNVLFCGTAQGILNPSLRSFWFSIAFPMAQAMANAGHLQGIEQLGMTTKKHIAEAMCFFVARRKGF